MPASRNTRRRSPSGRRRLSSPVLGKLKKAAAAAVAAVLCFAAGTQFSGSTAGRLEGALQAGLEAAGRVLRPSAAPSSPKAPAPASRGAGEQQTLTGKVIRVADGDTITIDAAGGTRRVRFLGIDAPEHDQEGGQASHLHLVSLVMGKTVTVRVSTTDQYGRVVGKVLVDGTDANLSQLKTGNAWFYRAYAKSMFPEDRAPYQQAELEARKARRGLWKAADPTPPWDFRRNRGKTNLGDFGERAAPPQPEKGLLERVKDRL